MIISSDHELLIEIAGEVKDLSRRMSAVENTQAVILQRMDTFDRRLTRVEDKIDSIQTSVYWTLSAIGIFLGTVAVIPLIAGVIALFKSQSKQEPDIDELARRVALKLGNMQQ